MPWNPVYPDIAGMLPVLKNAHRIVNRDIVDALAWAFGVNPPGAAYVRIQNSQHHSEEYPLFIFQPAAGNPSRIGNGGINQEWVFDCEIFVTKSIDASENFDVAIETLTEDVIRYYDATTMVLLSAPLQDWIYQFPEPTKAGTVDVWCSQIIFGQIEDSEEKSGLYLRSVAFETTVKLLESK